MSIVSLGGQFITSEHVSNLRF